MGQQQSLTPDQEFHEAKFDSLGGQNGQHMKLAFRHYPQHGVVQFDVNATTEFGSTILRGHIAHDAIQKLKTILGLGVRKQTVLVIIKDGKVEIRSNDATIKAQIVDASVASPEDLDSVVKDNPVRL